MEDHKANRERALDERYLYKPDDLNDAAQHLRKLVEEYDFSRKFPDEAWLKRFDYNWQVKKAHRANRPVKGGYTCDVRHSWHNQRGRSTHLGGEIKAMTNLVAHRGPDHEGFYFGKDFALGHRSADHRPIEFVKEDHSKAMDTSGPEAPRRTKLRLNLKLK